MTAVLASFAGVLVGALLVLSVYEYRNRRGNR